MPVEEYVTNCKTCGKDVYYRPRQLPFEFKTINENNGDVIVTCTCEGDGINKHTLNYKFPSDFKKVK